MGETIAGTDRISRLSNPSLEAPMPPLSSTATLVQPTLHGSAASAVLLPSFTIPNIKRPPNSVGGEAPFAPAPLTDLPLRKLGPDAQSRCLATTDLSGQRQLG